MYQPMKKRLVLVEAYVPDSGGGRPPPDSGLKPEHPIYIPVDPPPESGLSPEHPIFIPVYPDNSLPGDQPGIDNSLPGDQPGIDNSLPGDQPGIDNSLPGDQPHPEHPIYLPVQPPDGSDLRPEQPIYWPVYPEHPIVLPPEVDDGLTDEQKEALISFLFGNLPPFEGGPPIATPV